jgi:hypothetical protein
MSERFDRLIADSLCRKSGNLESGWKGQNALMQMVEREQ